MNNNFSSAGHVAIPLSSHKTKKQTTSFTPLILIAALSSHRSQGYAMLSCKTNLLSVSSRQPTPPGKFVSFRSAKHFSLISITTDSFQLPVAAYPSRQSFHLRVFAFKPDGFWWWVYYLFWSSNEKGLITNARSFARVTLKIGLSPHRWDFFM